MLNPADTAALQTLRRFLDETSFAYMSHRLIPGHDSIIWPDFARLHGALKQLNGIYRLLFTLLRQGHAADVVQQTAALGYLGVHSQLRGHQRAQVGDLNGMLQGILVIG